MHPIRYVLHNCIVLFCSLCVFAGLMKTGVHSNFSVCVQILNGFCFVVLLFFCYLCFFCFYSLFVMRFQWNLCALVALYIQCKHWLSCLNFNNSHPRFDTIQLCDVLFCVCVCWFTLNLNSVITCHTHTLRHLNMCVCVWTNFIAIHTDLETMFTKTLTHNYGKDLSPIFNLNKDFVQWTMSIIYFLKESNLVSYFKNK